MKQIKRCFKLKNCCRVLFAASAVCGHIIVVSAADWPTIPFPPNASAFAVGEQFTSNGMPMRVQGFLSKDQSVATIADWYRYSLGKPLVEDHIGNKLILGRAQGGYYLTVQLEPTTSGDPKTGSSKGLLTVSDMKGTVQDRQRYESVTQRWLQRWPAGSRVDSNMTSEDNGKTSTHVLITNAQDVRFNRNALTELMTQDGFVLERESSADKRMASQLPSHLEGAKALFFKGNGKEAVATIHQETSGRTAIVLNTTMQLEHVKP